VPAENSEKNAARSTTLYIRNGAGMEDYFYIFAQRHFLYTGRWGQCGHGQRQTSKRLDY
jgi:hypothetical protein